ncbi:CRISPR-associated endonuclease Cas2 [Candidatus Berkelbacteria bacterium RIFCSPHIGHO2_12_FULL_36_9]|uniref:CRISPR-associated endonuclease Cas2 n=1 Tax=Candidatus Berkelbacteria bacterium RIFCSPHIGHO2_12_FULL_36_9 TaxID=1797469 RepID=A0A1F5EJ60_9BACT|nr:MAG: CRISPR-associated endonuclease Cas2 [Candidatus Berkelbacteria bacterium RIFCSPHIGHO2_12_FULL_36_9]
MVYSEDIKKVVLGTKQILMYLVDLSVGIFEYGDRGRVYRRSIKEYWQQRDLNKERFSRDLYRLRRDKFIRIYFKDKEKIIELTKKGKERIRNYLVDDLKIETPEQWDKKWRIIIFDIPEEKKTARDVLAAKLKQIGFLRLQKSVFVFPYDCKDEIDFLKELYEIRPYIQYIVADRIDTEVNLLQHFFDNEILK